MSTDFLPVSRKDMEERGIEQLDFVYVIGDAYVDHPSFGHAIISRLLEAHGFRVGIISQPDWKDEKSISILGKPRLGFLVSAGNMDSMVNHYTAAKRRRSDDAYTPGNRSGARPDMPTIVYTKILKELFPDTPVIIGGIEASLRRFTHYDYWKDSLKPSILYESQADMLVYGMGEKPLTEICRMLQRGIPFQSLTNIPQTSVIRHKDEKYATNKKWQTIMLASHEECLSDKRKYAMNFRYIEEESNSIHAAKLVQPIGDELIIVNPPYPPMSTTEIDAINSTEQENVGQKMDVYQSLKMLKEVERTCITLFYMEDISIDKIAGIVGVPSGTVKSHLSRGKEKLATYLKQNGYDRNRQ